MAHPDDDAPPLFTYAVIAAIIVFFGAQLKGSNMSPFNPYPWRVADGECWRLLTCTFMHSGFLHILFNSMWLFQFSKAIEDWVGPWAALAIYVFTALPASAAELLVSPPNTALVGASGAVYGLFGFIWVTSRRYDPPARALNISSVQTMLGWLVICAILNAFGSNIGNTAHLVGLVAGAMLGWVFVVSKPWRIPVALLAILTCALPLVFAQRTVWTKTLAHLPTLGKCYLADDNPEWRAERENPDRLPRPSIPGARR